MKCRPKLYPVISVSGLQVTCLNSYYALSFSRWYAAVAYSCSSLGILQTQDKNLYHVKKEFFRLAFSWLFSIWDIYDIDLNLVLTFLTKIGGSCMFDS